MASADVNASPSADVEGAMSPGEFVLKKLFAEFVVISERKLKSLASQPLEYPLMKALQRGEDAHFDQLLNALNEVASFCLRSVLTSILKWRDMQIQQCRSTTSWSTVPSGDTSDSPSPASKREKEYLMERQELGVEFIFCLVLAEVLTKLAVHPVPESFIHSIEDLAFRHFKQQDALKDRTNTNPNIPNMKKIADLYAEVIGILSQARFHSVRRRFFQEIRDPHHSSATIISIIEGLSFVRVKMFPVEETEQWFAFLQECATYLLECGREKIKTAMIALLVEILYPAAAVINLEASLPVVRKFVNMLYNHCVEQAKRARHSNSYIPLVTALLAISEAPFFLNHWHGFLMQTILPGIRRGDSKVQRTAFEALYRLVWVYMVRIKGESNITTANRLRVIVEILFPRGQRGVQPKDMPLNIFVKLIQFVARERLEYCMNEIVGELLNVGRVKTNINPERMIIGLRAFLVIADNLEKKEGDPPMPVSAGPLPSGGPTRVKTKFLSTTLTDETAKKIGISQFYPYVCRALDSILRSLDQSIGRSLTTTNLQATGNKTSEEVLSGVKPKLDLLKMCVAAIPRIIPEGMSHEDLIDLLSRFTIHVDHELVRTAFASLQGLITNFPMWRHDVARVFVLFLLRDVPDSCPLVLEAALKMLIQFLSHWKSLLPGETGKEGQSSGEDEVSCVPWVEACALVMLCNYRSVTRRLSLVLLKEVRALCDALPGESRPQMASTVMDVVDRVTPNIIRRYLAVLSVKERTELRVGHHTLNLTWLADRSACFLEHGGSRDSLRDAWTQCLAGLLEPQLLPEACPTAVHLAWPYAFHRMVKAYSVLDPGYVAHEKGDRPPSLKGRRPIISSVEMFLWRNYLIFLSCTAPPYSSQASLMSSGDSSLLEGSGRFSHQITVRDLFRKVVPLIRTEGEIREVAITALGLVHPRAFGDLVDELQPHIHDALDQKKGDNPRKKRRREALRIQITRVFSLTAEHGCFRESIMARGDRGEVAPVLLEFIEGIKNYLDSETDRMMGFLQELRLHFAALVANVINRQPRGVARLRLFSPEMRYNLFYLFSNWCGLFGLMATETEQEMRARNPRASALSINSLQAMSALLCCGPVFHSKGLERESSLYRWLDNMLTSGEQKVQTLGRKTVQMLLQNNVSSQLLNWVIDQCYKAEAACAQLCFHALCNTLTTISNYPCDMVTMLHVVLYKTADTEPSTRERATQLLQVLDRRFFTAQDMGGRPQLTGCLTAGAYSSAHVTLSTELSEANPELTLPIFCEMVHRFDKVPSSGQRHILQYMVPWLRNVELTDDSPPHPHTIVQSDNSMIATPPGEFSNQVLGGSGWGSPEGTRVVLHNLLYITSRYGDEHAKEVEHLWAALCTWPGNIRTTLNYLARLTCVAGNMPLMLQQAKRIMVCLSRKQATAIVAELITELQSVELLSADLQVMDTPPFYHITSSQQRGIPIVMDTNVSLPEGMEGCRWAVAWRILVRRYEGRAVPLPMPPGKTYYASMRSMLRVPAKPAPLHRCNFALILLSELVLELGDVDWGPHLPLLLHVTLLGLDLLRPLVYEHSKKLLGHLVVVLACRGDKRAALQARFVQQDLALRSPSSTSLSGSKEEGEEGQLPSSSLDDSLTADSHSHSSLTQEAKDLIAFISLRDAHRPPWPFVDLSAHQMNPSGEVKDLTMLVGKVLRVFCHTGPGPSDLLRDKWAKIALQWATGCSSHQYASQSFQVCRALQLPLSTSMFREVVTRLAESALDQNEDMQSYVLEIVLTLESAVDHLQEVGPQRLSHSPRKTERKVSDLPPLPSELPETPSTLSPPPSAGSGAGVRHRHSRGRSVTSKVDMMRPSSAKSPLRIFSPLAASAAPLAIKERTPTHHKAATVTGTDVADGRSSRTPFVLDSVPSEGEKRRRGASFGSQPSRDTSRDTNRDTSRDTSRAPEHGRIQQSGLKVSPERGHSHSQVATDSGTPSMAITAPEPKPSRESKSRKMEDTALLTPTAGSAETKQSKEPKAKENDSLSATTTTEPKPGKDPKPGKEFKLGKELKLGKEVKAREADPRSRKSSEPPLSLQALFDPEISFSRQMNKQTSADEVTHLKQSSYDDSRARTPQGSPKHMRRMRSPAMPLIGGEMQRTPSHPHLSSAASSPRVVHTNLATSLPSGPLLRARSTQQIKAEADAEELSLKRRSYSGESAGKADMQNMPVLVQQGAALKSEVGLTIKDSLNTKKVPSPELQQAKVPVVETSSPGTQDGKVPVAETTPETRVAMAAGSSVVKEGRERSTSAPKDPQTVLETADIVEPLQAPLLQSSPSKQPYSDMQRRNSTTTGGRREGMEVPVIGRKGRPKSMIETSLLHSQSVDVIKSGVPDLLAKLFWTAASLLESDFEMEYTMAQRLLSKTLDQLDLASSDTTEHLEALLGKLKWSQFPGVQGLLLKGLTLESTSDPSRQLLSRITLYSSTPIFDSTCYAGLPLNIVALMPVLVYHFEQPTEFCVSAVHNIQQACDRVDLPSEDCKTKLLHMSRMLQMYTACEFTSGSDIWLAGICRYLNDAYTSVASRILTLLVELLEKGCALYHRPVLRLLYEYMRLQDPKSHETKQLADTIVTAVTRHIKGPLWKEALDLLKLAVSNSASLVQPPTRGLPVDLGHFTQTLPGPTLQFSMDLQPGSSDLGMAQEPVTTSAWKKPQQCQRRARERLLSVLNAFVPVPVLMSSPSVVFTDEQALMGEKATLYSSTSDEAISIPSGKDDQILESSQPESQVYITAVGHEFHFLDNFEYMYDSSSESETPGPFSGSFKALDVYREEEEGEGEEEEESSPATPLTGSHYSLDVETEEEEGEEDIGPPPAMVGESFESLPPIRSYSSEPAPLAVEPTSPVRASSPTPQHSPYGTSPPDDQSSELSQKSHGTEERSQGTEDTSHDTERSLETEEMSHELETLDLSQPTEVDSSPGLTLGITQDSLEGSLEQSYEQELDVPSEQQVGPPCHLPVVLAHEQPSPEQPHEQPVVSHEQSHEQPVVSHEQSHKQPTAIPHEQPVVSHEQSHEQPAVSHEQPHGPPVMQSHEPSHELPEAQLPREETQEQLELSISQASHDQSEASSHEQLSGKPVDFHEHKEPPCQQYEQQETSYKQAEASHKQTEIACKLPIASQGQLQASHEQPEQSHEQPEVSPEKPEASHEQTEVSCEQPEVSREQLEASDRRRPETLHELPGMSLEEASLKEAEAVAPKRPPPEHPGEVMSEWLKEQLSEDQSLAEKTPEQSLELPTVIFLQMSPEHPFHQSIQLPDNKREELLELQEGPQDQTSEPQVQIEGSYRPEEQALEEKPPDSGAEASHDTSQESHDEGNDIIDLGDERGSLSPERLTFELSDSLPAQELTVNIPLPKHPTWSRHMPEVSRFLNIANDEIDDAWRDHVTLLGRHKSPRTAVHTYFILHRLFSVIRQQFCSLTREACNYLGETHRAIAAHFLVTVELLLSQFELPRVYLDSEMLSHSNLLDQQVFLVLETHGNFTSYMERRKTVLQCLNHFKLALRQQSLATPLEQEPASLEPVSPDQAALQLCRAVHRFHFQLLVLLGSYVKLLGILQPALEHSGSADFCRELTEARNHIEESVLAYSRGPSPPLALDEGVDREVEAMSIADATRSLEDALGQKQGLRAVQLLHIMRKHWRGEEAFGSSDEDDMDTLFYIYARYATDKQEGMVCLTYTQHNLLEVHSKLMAQNVSLHSLLEQADHSHDHDQSHDLDSPLKSPVLDTIGESSC